LGGFKEILVVDAGFCDHVARMSLRGSVKAIHSLSSSIAALLSFRPSIREFFRLCPQAFKFDLGWLFSGLFQSLDSSVVLSVANGILILTFRSVH
jgi:hypothetical protein